MISVIIPAHNEKSYLNRTIDNFYKTAKGDIEIIVVLNGYEQEVDSRATVMKYCENVGERVAMNTAANIASGSHLLRIDAHCDVDEGWDNKMLEVFKDRPKAIAVPVLTFLDKQWQRHKGHWYAFCKLLPTMEEKWITKKEYRVIEPNMAFTGCGFMIAKDFYWEIGGADETLPAMGAIGPEFAVKAHLFGDGVFTRTDVIMGHIFDTGAYDTDGLSRAREMLVEKYGGRYAEIAAKFGEEMKKKGSKRRTITVRRTDEEVTNDKSGNVVMKEVKQYVYVYKDDGSGPTEKEIEEKYSPIAKLVSTETYYPDDTGKLVKVA